PEVYPVNCRAVCGSQSFLVIALSYPVQITHVTLEHIPRNVSPTGHINSTPKDFTVHTAKAMVEDKYQQEKEKTKVEVQKVPAVSVTADTPTWL
ncbi:hypothetical protein P4O66_023132, partial [Electrophorus voltai]